MQGREGRQEVERWVKHGWHAGVSRSCRTCRWWRAREARFPDKNEPGPGTYLYAYLGIAPLPPGVTWHPWFPNALAGEQTGMQCTQFTPREL